MGRPDARQTPHAVSARTRGLLSASMQDDAAARQDAVTAFLASTPSMLRVVIATIARELTRDLRGELHKAARV